MKRSLLIFGVIIIVILISGCCYLFEGTEQVVRTYSHNGSSNVTINIYKGADYNLTILESNSSDIQVVESLYLKNSAAKDSNRFIRDYVRFTGNSTNLSIDIDLESYVSAYEIKDANIHVTIYLPRNTNYSINKVGLSYFKNK
jgi:hypothetical protein